MRVKSSAHTVQTYLKLILRPSGARFETEILGYNIPLPEAFLLDLNFPVSANQYDCKIVFPLKFQWVISVKTTIPLEVSSSCFVGGWHDHVDNFFA